MIRTNDSCVSCSTLPRMYNNREKNLTCYKIGCSIPASGILYREYALPSKDRAVQTQWRKFAGCRLSWGAAMWSKAIFPGHPFSVNHNHIGHKTETLEQSVHDRRPEIYFTRKRTTFHLKAAPVKFFVWNYGAKTQSAYLKRETNTKNFDLPGGDTSFAFVPTGSAENRLTISLLNSRSISLKAPSPVISRTRKLPWVLPLKWS